MLEISKRIREMRELRERTQGQVGKAIRLSQREVSFLENGRRIPSIETLTSFLNYFHNRKPISEQEWEGFVRSFLQDTLGTVARGIGVGISMEMPLSGEKHDLMVNLQNGRSVAIDFQAPSSDRKIYTPANVKFLSAVLKLPDDTQTSLLKLLESQDRYRLLELVASVPDSKLPWMQTVLEGLLRK